MARQMRPSLAVTTACLLLASVEALAVGGKVLELRTASGRLVAAVELSDPFSSSHRAILEKGGALHVRIEAAVWEDRAIFDRPVEGPRVSVLRVIRKPDGSAIGLVDQNGTLTTYKPYPNRLRLELDTCALTHLADDARYYVDAAVTIGSLGEDELDEANEAVFGGEDPAGLKRIGKFLLNSVLQVKDYVGSASTDVRSSRFTKKSLKP
jgi:hypothetical protein